MVLSFLPLYFDNLKNKVISIQFSKPNTSNTDTANSVSSRFYGQVNLHHSHSYLCTLLVEMEFFLVLMYEFM